MSGGGSRRQEETEAEREVARIAAEKFNFYIQKFKPIEDWAMTQAQQSGTASAVARTTGLANVDAQTGLANEFAQVPVDPNSSRMNRVLTERERLGGSVAGQAGGRAVLGANDRYINSMANLASIGQGNEATAVTGLNRLANLNYGQTQNDITNQFRNRQLNQQAIGLPIGAGASAYANSLTMQNRQPYQPVGGDPYDDYNFGLPMTPSGPNRYEGYT